MLQNSINVVLTEGSKCSVLEWIRISIRLASTDAARNPLQLVRQLGLLTCAAVVSFGCGVGPSQRNEFGSTYGSH
jgi:hypothetical protein